jgi:hypothetical protein
MKTFNFTVNQNTTYLTIKSQNKLIFSAKFLNQHEAKFLNQHEAKFLNQHEAKFLNQEDMFSNGYIKFKDNVLIIGINGECKMETMYKLNYCEMMGLKYQIKNAYKKK